MDALSFNEVLELVRGHLRRASPDQRKLLTHEVIIAVMAENRPDPICPRCGLPSQRSNTRYGQRNDCCGLRSWGGKPLQDPETLEARRRAHEAFDPLWESGYMTRTQAYMQLATILKLHPDDCHMAKMTLDQALAVPAAVEKIKEMANHA